MLRFTRPSPALIVASIALVLALKPVAEAANTVFSTDIVDGEVKHADLAANSVTRVNIYGQAIDNARLAALAVTGDKIAADAVTGDKIASFTVQGSDIADSAIGPRPVADNSLTTLDLKGADAAGALSLAAGFVANGLCKDTIVNAAGSAVGDVVLFTPKIDLPAGVVVYGTRVAAAGKATLKVCNLTGGAFPAISNAPVRITTLS